MKRAYCILFLIQLFIIPSYAQDTTYVDLGLSVKWATCNLSANSPEEYGDYYAWGETETKEKYDWSTYVWYKGNIRTLTKYKISDTGKIDNKMTLDLEDDIAHIKLGGAWRMPTYGEVKELLNNCTLQVEQYNGVTGQKFTSKINGNSIFLPSAGEIYENLLSGIGEDCNYWTSSLCSDLDTLAEGLFIGYAQGYNVYFIDEGSACRCMGFPIRAVKE